MKKIRKNFSLEFKTQAVSLSEQRGNVSFVPPRIGDLQRNTLFEFLKTNFQYFEIYIEGIYNYYRFGI